MNAKIVPIDRRMDTHHEAFPSFENVTLLAYMQLADSKASVFLAMTTSAIAYLIARFGLAWLKIEKFSWHPVLLYVSVALLAVSAAYAMAVIVPRLAGSHGSVVHFRSVSRRATHQLYADDVLALSPGRNSSMRRLRTVMNCRASVPANIGSSISA